MTCSRPRSCKSDDLPRDDAPDSAIYHDIFRYRLRLRRDAAAWERACRALILRHPALRMSFDVRPCRAPMARVHMTVEAPVQVIDVVSLSLPERSKLWPLTWNERKRYRSRLAAGDRCISSVCSSRRTEIDLVFSFQHALLDGWSVATLMRDLITLYTLAKGPTRLARPDHDTCRLHQPGTEAMANEAHGRFWREYLHEAPVASMTSLGPCAGPGPTPHRSAYREMPAADAWPWLEAFCSEQDLPLRAVLLAAHGLRKPSVHRKRCCAASSVMVGQSSRMPPRSWACSSIPCPCASAPWARIGSS